MVPLHRNRDFLVLWSAQLVSTLGSQVSLVAVPLLVLALTGSPAKAGVVGFTVTAVFSLTEQGALPLVVAPDEVREALARARPLREAQPIAVAAHA